jgi:hypothetical protein
MMAKSKIAVNMLSGDLGQYVIDLSEWGIETYTPSARNSEWYINLGLTDSFVNMRYNRTSRGRHPTQDDVPALLSQESYDAYLAYVSNEHSKASAFTTGINNAINYASTNGYTSIKLPSGDYMVANDASINLVSNMKYDFSGCTIRREPDGRNSAKMINANVKENIIIEGGTFIGDRLYHDYSTTGTVNEHWVDGITCNASKNIILKNMDFSFLPGAAYSTGATNKQAYEVLTVGLEEGLIQSDGTLASTTGYTRTSGYYTFDGAYQNCINIRGTFNVGGNGYNAYGFEDVGQTIPWDLSQQLITYVFYNSSDEVVKVLKRRAMNNVYLEELPSSAVKFKFYFEKTFSTIYNSLINIRTDIASKNIIIQNCKANYCGVLGMNLSGGSHIKITNCIVSNNGDYAPGFGIDIEDGYTINQNIIIENSHFFGNKNGSIVAIGRNIKFSNNKFEDAGGVGIIGSKGDTYVSENNTYLGGYFGNLDNAYLDLYAISKNDTFIDANISVYGHIIFENANVVDCGFSIQTAGVCKIYNSKITYTNALTSNLFYAQPMTAGAELHIYNSEIDIKTASYATNTNYDDGTKIIMKNNIITLFTRELSLQGEIVEFENNKVTNTTITSYYNAINLKGRNVSCKNNKFYDVYIWATTHASPATYTDDSFICESNTFKTSSLYHVVYSGSARMLSFESFTCTKIKDNVFILTDTTQRTTALITAYANRDARTFVHMEGNFLNTPTSITNKLNIEKATGTFFSANIIIKMVENYCINETLTVTDAASAAIPYVVSGSFVDVDTIS